MSRPVVVPTTMRRDVIIGVLAGMILLGGIAFALFSMGNRVAGTDLTGVIVEKHFQPQEEQQITVGRAGMHEKQLDGQYTFAVRVAPDGKTYTVWVDKAVYESRNVGDEFRFPRPAPGRAE